MCNGQAPYELSRSGGHTQHPVMESRGGGEDVRAPGHSTRSLHVVSILSALEDTMMVDVFFSSDCPFWFFSLDLCLNCRTFVRNSSRSCIDHRTTAVAKHFAQYSAVIG